VRGIERKRLESPLCKFKNFLLFAVIEDGIAGFTLQLNAIRKNIPTDKGRSQAIASFGVTRIVDA